MFSIQDIVENFQAIAPFIGPTIFFVAFLGSLLGTNLIVPAGAVLTATGVLVGAGVVTCTVVIWAWGGAVAGLSASYSLGLRVGPHVRQLPLIRKRPEFVEMAERLFAQYGFASILIGYFSGPLRAAVASAAAVAGMKRSSFELANVTSALIWAAVALGIGALPGKLIEPNSIWLIIGPILVPVVTIAISGIILALRWLGRRKQLESELISTKHRDKRR
jgi:membrane-associated protein